MDHYYVVAASLPLGSLEIALIKQKSRYSAQYNHQYRIYFIFPCSYEYHQEDNHTNNELVQIYMITAKVFGIHQN